MKKPSSIRGHVKVLSSTVYLYQNIRPVFSLRAVIHEFFQKKLNYIKATKFFLHDPLTTRLVRLWRDYTVLKKHYPWSDLTNNTTLTPELFISFFRITFRFNRRIILWLAETVNVRHSIGTYLWKMI